MLYEVKVGAGGNRGEGGQINGNEYGHNSQFGDLIAFGGGCGGCQAGGSGGGGCPSCSGCAGVVGQGNAGGSWAGGGGGAGSEGKSQNGAGGNGKSSNISGIEVWYAGGGNGAYANAPSSLGNDGPGRGGGENNDGYGKKGIVIVSYPTLYGLPVTTSRTPEVVGSDYVFTFQSDGSIAFNISSTSLPSNITTSVPSMPPKTKIFTYTGAAQAFKISDADISNGYNTIRFNLFGAGAQDKIIDGNFLGMGGSGGQVITLKLLLNTTTGNNI